MLLVARVARTSCEAAAEQCGRPGGGRRAAESLACDVTDPDAGERIAAAAAERFGPVDVLVNNAGTARVARPRRRARTRTGRRPGT